MKTIKQRLLIEFLGSNMMRVFLAICFLLTFIIFLGLTLKSWPFIEQNNIFQVLTSSVWMPNKALFGLWPFISSTLWVTFTAMFIAVPPCLLVAIYLIEYAPKSVSNVVQPIIDVLSGIPSVIFGVWGIILIVPFISDYLAPLFGVSSSGYTVLAGGIVLAVSVFPVIIQLLLELFKSIPRELREASLSLGATKWQTIKWVMLRKAGPGVVSAVIIAFSRAFGETMSVILVTGNVVQVPKSIFDSAYPLPSLIANNYGETLSIPMYDSALMFVALILFVIVFIFNLIARYILIKVEQTSI